MALADALTFLEQDFAIFKEVPLTCHSEWNNSGRILSERQLSINGEVRRVEESQSEKERHFLDAKPYRSLSPTHRSSSHQTSLNSPFFERLSPGRARSQQSISFGQREQTVDEGLSTSQMLSRVLSSGQDLSAEQLSMLINALQERQNETVSSLEADDVAEPERMTNGTLDRSFPFWTFCNSCHPLPLKISASHYFFFQTDSLSLPPSFSLPFRYLSISINSCLSEHEADGAMAAFSLLSPP